MTDDYKDPAGDAPPDWRELCEELTHEVEQYALDRGDEIPDCVSRARAALARCRHQPAPLAEGDCPACEGVPKPGNQPCAVCGRSAPPAEGEVAELVAALRQEADACFQLKSCGYVEWASRLTRAADLLSQRHPAPVPVAERLPGPGDCDVEGRCWWSGSQGLQWELCRGFKGASHWLPATAPPLPACTKSGDSNE